MREKERFNKLGTCGSCLELGTEEGEMKRLYIHKQSGKMVHESLS
jgi:hypothetical protein